MPVRVRTGVGRDADGWWVVQNINGEVRYYGPTGGGPFGDEGQAEIAARAAACAVRQAVAS